MGIIALVRADFLKQRHTSYWGIHTVIPIAGAILFVFYFLLYQNVDELKKLRLLLELTAMVFPLLISVIVGLNITQEERASHFQSLLRCQIAGKYCWQSLPPCICQASFPWRYFLYYLRLGQE